VRKFASGATRDSHVQKLDYEGFFSPLVLNRFAQYMHENRVQADGKLRNSDNWQKGIPQTEYMKSAWRHFMAWWAGHRSEPMTQKDFEDAICALIFNAMGYLYEEIKNLDRDPW
jgi:hypothetical protein